MGIRFACPNGHKLNVKDEFAGRRAICPHCQAKVVVPNSKSAATSEQAEPSQQVDANQPVETSQPVVDRPTVNGNNAPTKQPAPAAKQPAKSLDSGPPTLPAAPAEEVAPPAVEAPAVDTTAPETSTTPAGTTGEDAWYVRTPSGEQYGPADTAAMRQWIADGRVAADSWTWRTGWDDWRPGTEAIAMLGEAPPVQPVAAMQAAVAGPIITDAPPEGGSAAGSSKATHAEARRIARERKKKRNRMITIVLGILALALGGVLAVVLLREEQPAAGKTPIPKESVPAAVAPEPILEGSEDEEPSAADPDTANPDTMDEETP